MRRNEAVGRNRILFVGVHFIQAWVPGIFSLDDARQHGACRRHGDEVVAEGFDVPDVPRGDLASPDLVANAADIVVAEVGAGRLRQNVFDDGLKFPGREFFRCAGDPEIHHFLDIRFPFGDFFAYLPQTFRKIAGADQPAFEIEHFIRFGLHRQLDIADVSPVFVGLYHVGIIDANRRIDARVGVPTHDDIDAVDRAGKSLVCFMAHVRQNDHQIHIRFNFGDDALQRGEWRLEISAFVADGRYDPGRGIGDESDHGDGNSVDCHHQPGRVGKKLPVRTESVRADQWKLRDFPEFADLPVAVVEFVVSQCHRVITHGIQHFEDGDALEHGRNRRAGDDVAGIEHERRGIVGADTFDQRGDPGSPGVLLLAPDVAVKVVGMNDDEPFLFGKDDARREQQQRDDFQAQQITHGQESPGQG